MEEVIKPDAFSQILHTFFRAVRPASKVVDFRFSDYQLFTSCLIVVCVKTTQNLCLENEHKIKLRKFRSCRPKVPLKILQNLQENTCVRFSFTIKL